MGNSAPALKMERLRLRKEMTNPVFHGKQEPKLEFSYPRTVQCVNVDCTVYFVFERLCIQLYKCKIITSYIGSLSICSIHTYKTHISTLGARSITHLHSFCAEQHNIVKLGHKISMEINEIFPF